MSASSCRFDPDPGHTPPTSAPWRESDLDGQRRMIGIVSSATFTEAAQERNIEAGVLVNDPAFARALRDQFESLAEAGLLVRLPGLDG